MRGHFYERHPKAFRRLSDVTHPMPELRRSGLAAYISAGVLLIAGGTTLALVELGALSALMVQHLLVMNVAAPVLGAALDRPTSKLASNSGWLRGAALAQMLLLWGWHALVVQQAAGGSLALHGKPVSELSDLSWR